jgi:prolyl oligopeptidase
MKKILFLMAVSTSIASLGQNQKQTPITYPKTAKGETVDVYFDTKVSDPYRWLEDDKSAETGAWVK